LPGFRLVRTSIGSLRVDLFIHRVMQIPDRLSRVLTKSGLLNQFIFYLFWRLSEILDLISEINEHTKFRTSGDFVLINTLAHTVLYSVAVTSWCWWNEISLRFGCVRCLFIVLGHIVYRVKWNKLCKKKI